MKLRKLRRSRYPRHPKAFSGDPPGQRGQLQLITGSPGQGEPPSKCHRCLIRAGFSARFTYFVRVGGMTTPAGAIGLETGVRDRYDEHSVAINVDVARSRATP